MRRPSTHLAAVLLLAGATLPAWGGDWHQAGSLVCSDCHTMHNSEAGLPMRYDGVSAPAQRLLRAQDATRLCLACHDGSAPDAPDVTAPVSYLTDPAAGWFVENPLGQPNPNGHDLLPPGPQHAPGSADNFVLTCLSCHAPHGSDSYRNLILEPSGGGNSGPVSPVVAQTVTADGTNPGLVYDPANLFYKSGIAAWCNDCHGDFHGRTSSEEGTAEPWLRHPQGEPISASYGSDYTFWSGTIAARVPVETPTDDTIPSVDDTVFCLSCHKAHGSAHPDGLIFADGATRLSTCRQCHNQADSHYTQTRHGDAAAGVNRLTTEPRGDCAQCHDQHASRDDTPTGGPHPYLLYAANDNQLCADCHTGPGLLGIFAGPTVYDGSLHGLAGTMVWPGGVGPRARPAGDAGLCVNCHTPHGRADGNGLVPSLLPVREETGCLTCHDGSGPAATDIASEFNKPYRHPTAQFQGLHQAGESLPTAFEGTNRHAECEDCHNPHDVQSDKVAPLAPNASMRIQGVSRVSVSNGAAGSQPVFTFRSADDPAPLLEYETCFKCHSSWITTIRAGSPDLGLLMNPNNPSYHPVEAPGKGTIPPGAFTTGWSSTDQMFCGDCHGSDDGVTAGPHGSLHAGLFASPGFRQMNPDELCFTCHDFETYADKDASDIVLANSRWNPPRGKKGHVIHFEKDVSCFSCHETHGSTANPYLLVFGRNPGIVSWADLGGGMRTCAPTCHNSKDYEVNY